MKKMKHSYLVAALLLLGSCGSDEAQDYSYGFEDDYEVPEEEVLEMITVTWEDLASGELEDGQPITIEGYVGPLPSTIYSYDDSELGIDLYERRNQSDGFHLDVDIPIGSSKNHVRSLPDDYQQSDLKIMTNEAETAGVGDYVRMEGIFTKSSSSDAIYFDADKIEMLEKPVFDESIFETAVELTNEVIEDESKDGAYVYMDVKMDLRMYMMVYDNEYTVEISQKNNKYLESASIRIGNSEGKMHELVDNFTDSDFIIYDAQGNQQKGASGKYRVYGTFNQLDTDSKGIFTVEEFVKL